MKLKATFFNQYGKVVLEVTKDARYEFNNGTRAINLGATSAKLVDATGNVIDVASYNTKVAA